MNDVISIFFSELLTKSQRIASPAVDVEDYDHPVFCSLTQLFYAFWFQESAEPRQSTCLFDEDLEFVRQRTPSGLITHKRKRILRKRPVEYG